MSIFQYTDLTSHDAFRILSLAPGLPSDPLQGKIIPTSLSSCPEYSAISYVWGSDEKPFTLSTPDGSLAITTSLNSALVRLRSTDQEIVLWADGICINQEDNNEKKRQVRLMRAIFKNAVRVLAHLGEAAEDSESAYDLLKMLGTANLAVAFSVDPQHHIGSRLYDEDKRKILPGRGDSSWEAIRAIFRRPWFRRAWIVQEVCVAKDIELYCGNWNLNWLILAGAVLQLKEHNLPYLKTGPGYDKGLGSATEDGHNAVFWLIYIRGGEQRGHRWPLLDLLGIFRKTTRSSLARDHFFALLGIASDGSETCFDPDYVEPLVSIVKRYAKAFIAMGAVSQMIETARLTDSSATFPSWIPDWTKGSPYNSLTKEVSEDLYQAAGNTVCDLSICENDSVLRMTASRFDIVKIVGTTHYEHKDSFSGSNGLNPLIDRLAEVDDLIANVTSYPTGERILDAHWKTLVGNRCERSQAAPESFGELFPRVRRFLERKQAKDESFDANGEEYAALWPFMKLLLNTFEMMRFGVTGKGYFGLFVNETQPGDVIHILLGQHTPYVLRRSSALANRFQLVGQCYTHGIMNGEFVGSKDYVAQEVFII